MPYKLIIRLKNNVAGTIAVDWLTIDESGMKHAGSVTAFDQDLYTIAASAKAVIVLVPGEDVYLTEVRLPKLSPARLAKAIPSALEDQLTDEPRNLHFAIAPKISGEPLPVAVVSREKMRVWLGQLQAYLREIALQVKVMLPDVLALPSVTSGYQVCIEQSLSYVRTGQQAGFVIEKEELFPVLDLILKQPGFTNPKQLQLYGSDATLAFYEKQFAPFGLPSTKNSTAPDILSLAASTLNGDYALNLLQGGFTPRHKKVSLQRLIEFSFAVMATWLFLLTLSNLSTYSSLHKEKTALAAEMQKIYSIAYADPKAMPADPKASLENELSALRATRSDSALFRLLYLVGPVVSQLTESGLSLKEMVFKNNQLALDVETSDVALTDKLHQALAAQGVNVKVSNAERSNGGLVETRLTVEELS